MAKFQESTPFEVRISRWLHPGKRNIYLFHKVGKSHWSHGRVDFDLKTKVLVKRMAVGYDKEPEHIIRIVEIDKELMPFIHQYGRVQQIAKNMNYGDKFWIPFEFEHLPIGMTLLDEVRVVIEKQLPKT